MNRNIRSEFRVKFGGVYATHMRSSTQGRAEYSMHFARYEEVPRSAADEIIGRSQGPKR